MIKVVAINSSPKMEKGRTAKILSPFLEGMEKAGATVELFYTKRLNFKPCDYQRSIFLMYRKSFISENRNVFRKTEKLCVGYVSG